MPAASPSGGKRAGSRDERLAGKAVEVKDRVELDRVRRYPGLAMIEVEEDHPRHARSNAQPYVAPGDAHLPAPRPSRVPVAARRGRLGDHVIAPLLDNEVQVAIVLGPNKHDRGEHGEDVMLERQPCLR